MSNPGLLVLHVDTCHVRPRVQASKAQGIVGVMSISRLHVQVTSREWVHVPGVAPLPPPSVHHLHPNHVTRLGEGTGVLLQ